MNIKIKNDTIISTVVDTGDKRAAVCCSFLRYQY